MPIRNIEAFFRPRRVAVLGAGEDPDSPGSFVFRNLIGTGFRGTVYPVHPYAESIQGVEAFRNLDAIPHDIDLAILTVSGEEVLNALEECGRKKVKGVALLSHDFESSVRDYQSLEERIRQTSSRYSFRVLGPNSSGFIRPGEHLNASLYPRMPRKGNIAFISKSATLSTALLDRVIEKNVGFSYIVSLGTKLDIDFSDLIDYLGVDPETRAIILYVEHIQRGRNFITAVRSFAGSKPIVVVKPAEFGMPAHAALTYFGFPVEEDKIYDAAFKRAGAVRVEEILDLFYLAETLAKQRRPRGKRLAVITNAGGPSTLAVDALLRMEGELAKLGRATVEGLQSRFPPGREVQNPVILLANASPEDYGTAVRACLHDREIDGLLVIHIPFLGTRPFETAEAVAAAIGSNPYVPAFTVWMGGEQVWPARDFLNEKGIPTFITPEQAVKSFLYLYCYDYNLKLLRETPEVILKDFQPDIERVREICKRAAEEDRTVLSLSEIKEVLQAYGILVVTARQARSEEAARDGIELAIGAKKDPSFGSVIVFGTGGELLESLGDYAVGLPPLNQTLARRLMEETRVYRHLASRAAYAKTLKILEEVLIRFSQLVIDFPCIKAIDINPFLVTEREGFVLNAGMLLEQGSEAYLVTPREELCPSHLSICPYPYKFERSTTVDGTSAVIRPIRPEDEPLIYDFFKGLSQESIQFRFGQFLTDMPHERLVRYCQIDYDRELAFVAVIRGGDGQDRIIADVRIIRQPDVEIAELAILVADAWQGHGIGTMLLDYCIGIAKEVGIRLLWMEILRNNARMLHLARATEFTQVHVDEDMVRMERDLSAAPAKK